MTQDAIGFGIEYRSLGDLAEDYRSHLKQNRMVLSWTDKNPLIGQKIDLRLDIPGGGQYALCGVVSRNAAGKGFAIEIAPESKVTIGEIEQLVGSTGFQQAMKVESPSTKNTRAVSQRPIPKVAAPKPVIAPAPKPMIPAATTGSGRVPGGIPAATTGSGRPGGLPAPAGGMPAPSSSVRANTPGPVAAATPLTPTPAPVAALTPTPPPSAKPRIDDLTDDYDDGDEDDDDDDDDSEDEASDPGVDRYDDYDDEIYGEEDEDAAQPTDDHQPQDVTPGAFRTPAPGESYVLYIVKFKTVLDFGDAVQQFKETQRMVVPFANDPAKEGDLAQLRIICPGRNVFSIWALVGRIKPTEVTVHVNPDSPTFALALAFPLSVAGKRRRATEKPTDRGKMEVLRLLEDRAKEDLDAMPVRRRVQRMSMEDKINMALSGGREERMALAMDGNKAIHHYLLRNARLSMDEVTFMTRLPTMNPDVLAKIAENPQYTQNVTLVKNLVYNPKTPILIAIKLLDRLPRSEVLSLSKRMSMNGRLVQAAKKKVGNK